VLLNEETDRTLLLSPFKKVAVLKAQDSN